MPPRRIEPFAPSDLLRLPLPYTVTGPLAAEARRTHIHHPGWTVWEGNQPVAAGGIIRYHPGVGEAWAVCGPLERHKVYCYRAACDRLWSTAEVLGLWRVQALVIKGWAEAERVVRHLGFEYEATLVKFGVKGEDVAVYRRLF